MANPYLEKISAWKQKEPGLMYDHEANSYSVSPEKVEEILAEKEKEHVSRGAKTFASILGLTGAAIGAAKGGAKGALVGGISSAALGALAGSAMASGGNKQLRENEGHVTAEVNRYLGSKYHRGWHANVSLEKIAKSNTAEKAGYGTAAAAAVGLTAGDLVIKKKVKGLAKEYNAHTDSFTRNATDAHNSGERHVYKELAAEHEKKTGEYVGKLKSLSRKSLLGHRIGKAVMYGGVAAGIAGSIASASKESK